MDTDTKVKIIYEAYRNPTKMNIIFLLTEYGKMTVTAMANYIPVSRSNLYHLVSQMVSDRVLNEPEVKIKGNYVEKFYSLNEELFKFSGPDEIKHVSNLSIDEFRELSRSFLLGLSFNLNMLSEKIVRASNDEIEKLKKSYIKQETYIGYFLANPTGHPKILEYLRLIKEELEKTGEISQSHDVTLTRIMLLVLPSL